MGITLLAHKGMTYRDHSFTQAVYLINIVPSSALCDFLTPYQALYKQAPDYLGIRISGCAYFPQLHPYNSHKLQLRYEECVYLGISPSNKGHKCLSPPVTNTHPMVTCSKIVNLKSRVLLTHLEPSSVKQALTDLKWLKAMQVEYKALMNNETWTLVPLPPHRKPIGCKWVIWVKENPDGSINKCKARLVAKGFHQQVDFNFKETFCPVVKLVTIHVILTLALTYSWPIQQIDANNAFLNSHLEKEVFMVQPLGFEAIDKSLVCKLNKALYGLKQAPRAWYQRLTKALMKFNFTLSRCDPLLFTYSNQGSQLFVLV